jgi:hypothetical protein
MRTQGQYPSLVSGRWGAAPHWGSSTASRCSSTVGVRSRRLNPLSLPPYVSPPAHDSVPATLCHPDYEGSLGSQQAPKGSSATSERSRADCPVCLPQIALVRGRRLRDRCESMRRDATQLDGRAPMAAIPLHLIQTLQTLALTICPPRYLCYGVCNFLTATLLLTPVAKSMHFRFVFRAHYPHRVTRIGIGLVMK